MEKNMIKLENAWKVMNRPFEISYLCHVNHESATE